MKCGSLKKKIGNNICFNPDEELILSGDMSEDDRYSAIIDHYKRQKSRESNLLNEVSTLEDAIKVATAQGSEKKKHSHQYLIPQQCLEEFCEILLARKDLMMSVKRFNDLYAIVKEASIKGIGELCIYDTTERIGTFLGVLPDEVYLHRGTRVGAVRLLGKVKKNRLVKTDFPFPFQRDDLSCAEIEDIIFIYKDKF